MRQLAALPESARSRLSRPQAHGGCVSRGGSRVPGSRDALLRHVCRREMGPWAVVDSRSTCRRIQSRCQSGTRPSRGTCIRRGRVGGSRRRGSRPGHLQTRSRFLRCKRRRKGSCCVSDLHALRSCGQSLRTAAVAAIPRSSPWRVRYTTPEAERSPKCEAE